MNQTVKAILAGVLVIVAFGVAGFNLGLFDSLLGSAPPPPPPEPLVTLAPTAVSADTTSVSTTSNASGELSAEEKLKREMELLASGGLDPFASATPPESSIGTTITLADTSLQEEAPPLPPSAPIEAPPAAPPPNLMVRLIFFNGQTYRAVLQRQKETGNEAVVVKKGDLIGDEEVLLITEKEITVASKAWGERKLPFLPPSSAIISVDAWKR